VQPAGWKEKDHVSGANKGFVVKPPQTDHASNPVPATKSNAECKERSPINFTLYVSDIRLKSPPRWGFMIKRNN